MYNTQPGSVQHKLKSFYFNIRVFYNISLSTVTEYCYNTVLTRLPKLCEGDPHYIYTYRLLNNINVVRSFKIYPSLLFISPIFTRNN